MDYQETGEDIKVMGLREYDKITLTISCAFVGWHLKNIFSYSEAKERLATIVGEMAQSVTDGEVTVRVNVADDIAGGSIFLTVTGMSAEAGDDGQTGRGNRANGLITPYRPMTMESLAGKNPITHVGKLYNTAAARIAESVISEVSGGTDAECYRVSEIGAPINNPRVARLRIRYQNDAMDLEVEDLIKTVVTREIEDIPKLWKIFVVGSDSY